MITLPVLVAVSICAFVMGILFSASRGSNPLPTPTEDEPSNEDRT